MTKVRWGILSTAHIAMSKVIPAMQRGSLTEVVAIASRDAERATSAAKQLGIPRSYGAYVDLLADPNVDAIYNPLPNHLHIPWTVKAMAAGKHVLCEKPIALSAGEARQLVAASQKHPKLKVMEAFMYRHHPQWQAARQMLRDGKIGALRTIQTFFSYYNVDPANIRHHPEMGGGALMDIGCYPVSLSRWLFESNPRRVFCSIEMDPQFGVDRLVSGIMDFGSGSSVFTCGTQLEWHQRVNIVGTEGRIEIEIPFNAPPDRPCRLWLDRKGTREEIIFPVCDQYTIQGDLFAGAVLNNTPVPTPIGDAIANMEVLVALFASSRTGMWV